MAKIIITCSKDIALNIENIFENECPFPAEELSMCFGGSRYCPECIDNNVEFIIVEK